MSRKFIIVSTISFLLLVGLVIAALLSIKSITVKVTDKEELTEVHFVTFLDMSRGEVIKCQVKEKLYKEIKRGTKFKVASLWCPLVLAGEPVK